MLIKTKAVKLVDFLKVYIHYLYVCTRVHSYGILCAYLQSIADKMSGDMQEWIGKNYRQEVDW